MTLTAVLFAGGESRRMGRDKALLEIDGEALWKKQLATLGQVGAEEVIVSARVDQPWRPNEVAFVADGAESHGPWSGLMATLACMRTTHLLALAIDLPAMTAEYLNSLGQRLQEGAGIIPKIGERYEPLAAFYPRGVDVDLAQFARDGDYSLQNLIRRLIASAKMRAVIVSESESSLFRNLNEPRDLHATA